MATANNDSVDDLISKHLAGETSVEEENALSEWIKQSEENRLLFASLKKAFDLSTRHLQMAPVENINVDVEHEWDHFQQSIGIDRKVRSLSPVRTWMRIAASLLILIALGALVYYFAGSSRKMYQTANNIELITLSDGSKVTLNRYTTLTIDNEFGKNSRTLTLEGEAFFNVVADARRPFVILAENAKVQVIGTSFNVNCYDTLDNVEVVVETGVVSLEPAKGGAKPAHLLPGEKGIFSKSDARTSIAVNQDVNFLAWNTQHLVFVDADLLSVIQTLEKTYHVQIEVNARISPSCIVTVTFDKQSLESVMRVLESTLNLDYTINGNKVLITEAGC